ncbi:MAG: YggT family protein [Bacteroidetes bacterium]|nr:YggT family protein [Bacteroidota bacterium]
MNSHELSDEYQNNFVVSGNKNTKNFNIHKQNKHISKNKKSESINTRNIIPNIIEKEKMENNIHKHKHYTTINDTPQEYRESKSNVAYKRVYTDYKYPKIKTQNSNQYFQREQSQRKNKYINSCISGVIHLLIWVIFVSLIFDMYNYTPDSKWFCPAGYNYPFKVYDTYDLCEKSEMRSCNKYISYFRLKELIVQLIGLFYMAPLILFLVIEIISKLLELFFKYANIDIRSIIEN